MVLFFILGGPGELLWTSPYLNVQVFGINVDSVLNDVGILMVSGLLKVVVLRIFAQFKFAGKKLESECPVTEVSTNAYEPENPSSTLTDGLLSNAQCVGCELQVDVPGPNGRYRQ